MNDLIWHKNSCFGVYGKGNLEMANWLKKHFLKKINTLTPTQFSIQLS